MKTYVQLTRPGAKPDYIEIDISGVNQRKAVEITDHILNSVNILMTRNYVTTTNTRVSVVTVKDNFDADFILSETET